MRLLHAKTKQIIDFSGKTTPPYVILSHTWGEEEVTFQDMRNDKARSKQGFAKIARCCDEAIKDGIEYAWIDTCCIDKSSSTELSEAINSMFSWYRDAAVCFVFVVDLPPDKPTENGLDGCYYFTRGWTLQELLAPANVKFYDQTWGFRGSKIDFATAISKYTGVPSDVLGMQRSLFAYSVAARMSWAANRTTTRIEDTAYCLLGIFDVNMPLIYGEGLKAFHRLQEEIVKHSNDLTIFAWDVLNCFEQPYVNLFASTPSVFSGSSMFIPYGSDLTDFSVTNKGLLIRGEARLRAATITRPIANGKADYYVLYLGMANTNLRRSLCPDGGIYLRKIGPHLF